MRFFVLVVLVILAACQDNSGISAQQRNAAAADKITFQIYTQIMNSVLGKKLTSVSNNSNLRLGDSNPYRKGYPGYSHKAVAACLAWKSDTVVVSRKYSQSFASDTWDYAAVGALIRCEDKKRQKSLSCNCQLVDHDDVNVLKVPDDYWAAYERKYGSGNNIAPRTVIAGERQFYLEMTWENLLDSTETFPVMVREIDRAGYVKSASLIGGKKCDAVFMYHESGQGEWEVTCTDGTSATGVLQFRGQGKGSSGSGLDGDGNKIEFSLTEEVPKTKT